MPTLLQINTTANSGSTGRIAEEIGRIAISQGWDSYIAYGRGKPQSQSHLIRIGNDWDMYNHILQSRLFDNHGLASKNATKKFIQQIEEIRPDIIHLHNIHGYFLNYEILFQYLSQITTPIIWTLHDCWSFTGHCGYYDYARCDKWQVHCMNCPNKQEYPKSYFMDRSGYHYALKKRMFNQRHIVLVCVSEWLAGEVKKSFLRGQEIKIIHNGIDTSIFDIRKHESHNDEKLILGVASVWHPRKGLNEFIKLRHILPYNYKILLIGLSHKQQKELPNGLESITRTENINELAAYYSAADVFVNPTFEDNYPTTNIEALASGTPVITYNTGGSPELINAKNGIVVDTGNINQLANAIIKVCSSKDYIPKVVRDTILPEGQKEHCFKKYFELYESLVCF